MALAAPNEPLILKDGTKIDPATGKVIKDLPVVITAQSKEVKPIKQVKRLTDLPDPTNKMNAIAVVMAYKLFGLMDQDISTVTNISTDILAELFKSDSYIEFYNATLLSIRENNSATIRDMLSNSADVAANKLLEMLESPDEKVAFAAAKDLLDRSGNSATAIVEHKHSLSNGLIIEVVTRDTTKPTPIIDINAEDILNG